MPTALVTGANRGIGLSLTRQLKELGFEVIAACRQTSAQLSELGVLIEEGVDVGNGEDIRSLASRLEGVQIDWLINNAGILGRTHLESMDFDSALRQFQINSLGPLRVTEALLPNLGKGAKVGIVTSRMGSIADNDSGGHYGYRMSKAAVNAAGKSLAIDLAPRGIAVALLHPGWVQTEMTGGTGHVGPDEAAAGLIARMQGLSMENTGSFWHAQGQELPW